MSLVCRARINVGDWVQVLNLRSTKIFRLAQGQTKGQGKGASVVLAASMAHVAAHLTIWALA